MGNNLLAATTGPMRNWGGKLPQRGENFMIPHIATGWGQWSGLLTVYNVLVAVLFLIILILVIVLLWKNIQSFDSREETRRETRRR